MTLNDLRIIASNNLLDASTLFVFEKLFDFLEEKEKPLPDPVDNVGGGR